MTEVITIGVELAKTVFQVHGVDGEGGVVFPRRWFRRVRITPRHWSRSTGSNGVLSGRPAANNQTGRRVGVARSGKATRELDTVPNPSSVTTVMALLGSSA